MELHNQTPPARRIVVVIVMGVLIGFASGLRRSELAAIDVTDLERVREEIVLIIRRSKTDQDGAGRKVGIPFGGTIHCPVRAVENWLRAARIEGGPYSGPSIGMASSRADSPAKRCP